MVLYWVSSFFLSLFIKSCNKGSNFGFGGVTDLLSKIDFLGAGIQQLRWTLVCSHKTCKTHQKKRSKTFQTLTKKKTKTPHSQNMWRPSCMWASQNNKLHTCELMGLQWAITWHQIEFMPSFGGNFSFKQLPWQALLPMNHANTRSAFAWLYQKLKYLGNY